MLRHTHPSRATGPSVIYDTRSISHEPRRAGLDVDARSVKGCAIDRETGEILRQSLAASDAGIAEWVSGLPGPVLVVYEAGPTGFGLARLALLGQITLVRVPGRADEAARDLVRAREDVRADLMRARHRVSKLLLRHGLVYSGGHAWTDAHHTWLHRQRFDDAALQAAYEASLETAELTLDRRNRLDSRITDLAATDRYAPVVRALMCLRGVSVLTAFGLAVEIGDWTRCTGNTIGAYLGLVPRSIPPALPGPRAGSPRPATPMPAACWSRPPGTTAGPTTMPAVTCAPAGTSPMKRPGSAATRATTGCTASGSSSRPGTNAGSSRTSPSPGNWLSWCWSLAAPVQQEQP
jgi:transposase